MNKPKIPKKKGAVVALIARSRFVARTEFFDAKMVLHDAQPTLVTEPKAEAKPIQKAQLVIAVPRRVGSAPVRNRCRRRIRELVRKMKFSSLPCDLIFFVRSSCATVPIEVLRQLLEKVRKRVEKMLLQ